MKKKMLSIVLVLTLLLSIPTSAYADNGSKKGINIATSNSNAIADLAIQHLSSVRPQIYNSATILGFNPITFQNMVVGTPFIVYTFDDKGTVLSNNVYSCPLIYNGDIVGIIGLYYDSITQEYYYSLGKEYADQLNELQNNNSLNLRDGIVIGRIGDKLFATDGSNVHILLEQAIENTDIVDIGSIKKVSRAIKENASKEYRSIMDTHDSNGTLDIVPKDTNYRSYPNPLPVPHVAQGNGICGVAAWAAVLNYRFSTSYTTPSLTTAMNNGGYVHGSNGAPNMSDYKNFANDNYSAGCNVAYNPPSYANLTSAITNGRPIMGSWYSGTGNNTIWHAIIITGYTHPNTTYTYYLKNPWYTTATTITVTSSSNVIYVDGSYTWTLSQSVY